MKKAIVHINSGKSFPVEYESDEIEDIIDAIENPKAIIAFIGISVYVRSIEAIEWID